MLKDCFDECCCADCKCCGWKKHQVENEDYYIWVKCQDGVWLCNSDDYLMWAQDSLGVAVNGCLYGHSFWYGTLPILAGSQPLTENGMILNVPINFDFGLGTCYPPWLQPAPEPTPKPTKWPTKSTKPPTPGPTPELTKRPTKPPTPTPTKKPKPGPTPRPTKPPTAGPTPAPTKPPTPGPTPAPTKPPTPGPTPAPTIESYEWEPINGPIFDTDVLSGNFWCSEFGLDLDVLFDASLHQPLFLANPRVNSTQSAIWANINTDATIKFGVGSDSAITSVLSEHKGISVTITFNIDFKGTSRVLVDGLQVLAYNFVNWAGLFTCEWERIYIGSNGYLTTDDVLGAELYNSHGWNSPLPKLSANHTTPTSVSAMIIAFCIIAFFLGMVVPRCDRKSTLYSPKTVRLHHLFMKTTDLITDGYYYVEHVWPTQGWEDPLFVTLSSLLIIDACLFAVSMAFNFLKEVPATHFRGLLVDTIMLELAEVPAILAWEFNTDALFSVVMSTICLFYDGYFLLKDLKKIGMINTLTDVS